MCVIVKYVLLVVNLVNSLLGLAVVGLCTAALLQTASSTALIPANLPAIPICALTLGVLAFVVCNAGCVGIVKENKWFMPTYSLVVFIMAVCNIAIIAIIFKDLDFLHKHVAEWLGAAIRTPAMLDDFTEVQIDLLCCGTTGSQSYVGILPELPQSCCLFKLNEVCRHETAFGGCNEAVTNLLTGYGETLFYVILVVVLVELSSVILSLIFWRGYVISKSRVVRV